MSEPEENGYRRVRPRLPLWITIVSIVVAIGSVSVLVLVLYEETKGPAEILREFARRVDRGDCGGSYDLLAKDLTAQLAEEEWCSDHLPRVAEQIDAGFHLESATLEGDIAHVEISGVPVPAWTLSRFGERSWRVVGPFEGLPSRFLVGTSFGSPQPYTDIENIP